MKPNTHTYRLSTTLASGRKHLRAVGTLLTLVCALLFTGCVNEDEYDDTQAGNFEALWKIMDEHYCFFQEKGIDWDSVHAVYAKQIDATMTSTQLLEVLGNMLATLHDGHVNLYASFDMARYWGFHENYPSNYSDTLVSKYLGTDYKIASGLRYRILDDNIGYIRCSSFSTEPGSGNLDEILLYLAPCRALIIDLRDNGGGLLTAAEKVAARFTNEKRLVGYMQHKTGRGHNDFSAMEQQWLKPASAVRWQKPVAVLTNRQVFSAANEFVKYMKCCPNVIQVGDQTGGGAGMPFSSELPNGWSVRFSACPMYDHNGNSTENGIAPDIKAALGQDNIATGHDDIIEAARKTLRTMQN